MTETNSTPTKFIFVTGGVVSSLGKGITAASLGRLLVQRVNCRQHGRASSKTPRVRSRVSVHSRV
jgi:hypothetical protein